jgi:aminoglycoside 2''-phosphotransferase
MPLLPWEADRELKPDQVHAAVSEQFAELRPVRVEYLGSGWGNDAFLVNGEWVFRFSRQSDAVPWLEREIAVAPRVAAILKPFGLTTPRFGKLGKPGPHFPYAFTCHRLVPGVAGDALPKSDLDVDVLARTLGRALGALHVASIDAVDLPSESDGPKEWLARLRGDGPRVRAALPADLEQLCEPWIAGRVELPADYTGALRLLHNDLCPDHILVDERDGRPVGMIDFSDISLGDPVNDFVPFYCWLGGSFAERLLDHYAPALDRGFPARLAFQARVLSLVWLGETYLKDGESNLAKHVAWIRRAFDLA